MRYAILRTPTVKPLLALFGGPEDRAYVQIDGPKVRAHFGAFDETFDVDVIARAGRTTWPLLGGLGWRLWFGGTVGLTGSYRNVVELVLREPRTVGVFPVRVTCKRLCVSLEDPDGFLRELENARPKAA